MIYKAFSCLVCLLFIIISPLQSAPQTPALTLENRILTGSITLPIATVLEAFLATTNYNDCANMLLAHLDEKNQQINPVRKALADKWISNAAGHIFHQELRSFLEIVVNACDASVSPDKAVGKFGMGFFSVLKLLDLPETNGTKISLDTTYQEGKQLKRYILEFAKNKAGEIIVTFTGKQLPKNAPTGTCIIITPNSKNFSASTLMSLLKYVTYLRCYPHASIALLLSYGKEYGREVINQQYAPQIGKRIEVLLEPSQLKVTDQGTGISLQTALTRLLIPSSSTKIGTPRAQIVQSSLPQIPAFVLQTDITKDTASHFFIAINGVIVIDKILKDPILSNTEKIYDLLINMPQGTQLTLARNELLIKLDGSSIEEKYLKQIITNTIQALMNNEGPSAYLLEKFYQGLQTWETESAARHLSGRFTTFVQQELDRLLHENKNCFAVPVYIIPSTIEALLPGSKIRVIPINPDLVYHNYEPFEEFLIKEYKQRLTPKTPHYEMRLKGISGSLIQGMHVIFAPRSIVSYPTMLGLRTCLFVPESFLTQSPTQTALINKLMTALPTYNLKSANNTQPSRRFLSHDPSWEKDRTQIGLAQNVLDLFCAKDMTWIDNITRPLSTLAPTLKEYLHACLRSFNVFHLLCNESKIISDQTKKTIAQLKQSNLGRSNAYFSITSADIPFIYGGLQQNLFLTHNGVCTGWGAAMVWLLEQFEQNRLGKKVIPKLLQFQKLDFARKTDLFLRNKKLAAQALYVPDMCLGTPIALLAAIAQTKKSSPFIIKLLATIVQDVKSLEELTYVTLALNTMPPLALEQLCSTRGIVAAHLALKHYVQEKIEHEQLVKFYEATWEIDFTDSQSINLIASNQEPSCHALQNLLRSLAGQETNFPEVQSALPEPVRTFVQAGQPVLLSQLLNAHCQGVGLLNDLQNNRVTQIQAYAARMSSTKLEKITQNIQAGSEKDPLEGTIIECLQNSIDATKKLYRQNKLLFNQNNARAHVDIQLGWMRSTHDNSSIVLTLNDYAGFANLKELLTDFILPDLSSKSSSQELVGQMGNGSFKLYQDAEEVNIVTRTTQDSSRCYLLAIKPIRCPQTKNVIDLELKWHDISEHIATQWPAFFGTSITVKFQETEHEHTQMTLASTLDFLRNGVGSCYAQLDENKHFTITLNKSQQLNQPDKATILYEHTIDNKIVCRILKNYHSSRQSYVTTAGIPFRSLNSVAQEMHLLPPSFCKELEQGYVVDLAPGFYEPVQSRTHLHMSKVNTQELCYIFFELFFIDGLCKAFLEIKNPHRRCSFLARHFTHFLSNQNIEQLKLNASDCDNFQKTFENWIKSGTSTQKLLPEAFFDFYKPLSFRGNSFSNFYDVISILSKKVSYINKTMHEKIVDHYLNEHESDINKCIISPANCNQPDKILFSIKNHFNRFLCDNQKKFNDGLYSVSQNVIADILQNITINGNKISQELSQYFVEQIIKNWINRKMKESNFTINRSFALNILLEKEVVASVKDSIKKEQLVELVNKPPVTPKTDIKKASVRPIPESQQKILKQAWTLFCQEFFIALGKPQPEISCMLSQMLSEKTQGCYLHNDQTILLNPSSINIDAQLRLIQVLAVYDPNTMSLEPIIESSAFKELYAPVIGKAPTLLHELEHARRAEQIDADKNSITGCGNHTQGYDAQGNLVHFDACANSWGAYAIGQGLIENWTTRLKELVAQNKHEFQKTILDDFFIK